MADLSMVALSVADLSMTILPMISLTKTTPQMVRAPTIRGGRLIVMRPSNSKFVMLRPSLFASGEKCPR